MSAEEITLGKSLKGGQKDKYRIIGERERTFKIWKSRHVWSSRRY